MKNGLGGGAIVKSQNSQTFTTKKRSLFLVLKTQSTRAALLEEVDIDKELGCEGRCAEQNLKTSRQFIQ